MIRELEVQRRSAETARMQQIVSGPAFFLTRILLRRILLLHKSYDTFKFTEPTERRPV